MLLSGDPDHRSGSQGIQSLTHDLLHANVLRQTGAVARIIYGGIIQKLPGGVFQVGSGGIPFHEVEASHQHIGPEPVDDVQNSPVGTATDADGNTVEAEVVEDDVVTADDLKDERKVVYYVTDLNQQGQYINLFKEQGMNAVILDHNIDTSFITQLEQRNTN